MIELDRLKALDLPGFLERHYGIRVNGNGAAVCPFHEDRNPSLSVQQKNGLGLFNCHACGAKGTILDFVMKKEGLSLREAARRIAELEGIQDDLRPAEKLKFEIVRTHVYTDETGAPVWEKIKLADGTFRCRRREGDHWTYKLNGVERVPYRLDKIKDEPAVIVCEGEKDADTLAALGFPATSGPSGKDSWPDEITPRFAGKECRIIFDVGQDAAALAVAAKLSAVSDRVFIMTVPLPDHEQDITDYLDLFAKEEGKRDAFYAIAAAAQPFQPEPSNGNGASQEALAPGDDSGLGPEVQADFPVIRNAFLNRYVESIARSTDASPIFLLFSGIALLSGVLNKFYFMFPRRTNLNLYVLLLAPSTYYRKSTTTDVVADYLNEINPSLLLPDSFTPEALYKILNKYPRGLIIWRELIQVKEFQLGSEYNRGLASFLVDIYDYKKSFKRWTVGDGGEIIVENPIVSILSAGIATWFVESLKKKDFEGGIWTRFIFVPAPEQDREYRLPSAFYLDRDVEARLRELDALEVDQEVDIRCVLPLMEEWGREHMRQVMRTEGTLQAVFQRLEVMLLKLACLFQLAEDGSLKVGEQAFRDAVTVIEWIKAQLPRFFQEEVRFGWFEKQMATVEKLLRRRGQTPRGEILHATGIKAKVVDDILKQLVDEGRIEPVEILPTSKGGRGGTAYRVRS